MQCWALQLVKQNSLFRISASSSDQLSAAQKQARRIPNLLKVIGARLSRLLRMAEEKYSRRQR